jgi:uncharacterized protein (DUF1330 family)
MSVFVIAERIAVHDRDAFQRYLREVSPTIESRGGRYHVVTSEVEVLEGEWRPGSLVLFEFPTREAALDWWSSDDYAPLKALRQATATYNIVLAPGLGD